jgi:hypothetical protein
MSNNDDAEFHRLIRRRTDFIESLAAVCDSAASFGVDLDTFAHRARNRAAVEKMLQEVVAVREACQEILERLQGQPAPPPDDAGAPEPPAVRNERKWPEHLRPVGDEERT